MAKKLVRLGFEQRAILKATIASRIAAGVATMIDVPAKDVAYFACSVADNILENCNISLRTYDDDSIVDVSQETDHGQ